jgi:hypothetical protein
MINGEITSSPCVVWQYPKQAPNKSIKATASTSSCYPLLPSACALCSRRACACNFRVRKLQNQKPRSQYMIHAVVYLNNTRYQMRSRGPRALCSQLQKTEGGVDFFSQSTAALQFTLGTSFEQGAHKMIPPWQKRGGLGQRAPAFGFVDAGGGTFFDRRPLISSKKKRNMYLLLLPRKEKNLNLVRNGPWRRSATC